MFIDPLRMLAIGLPSSWAYDPSLSSLTRATFLNSKAPTKELFLVRLGSQDALVTPGSSDLEWARAARDALPRGVTRFERRPGPIVIAEVPDSENGPGCRVARVRGARLEVVLEHNGIAPGGALTTPEMTEALRTLTVPANFQIPEYRPQADRTAAMKKGIELANTGHVGDALREFFNARELAVQTWLASLVNGRPDIIPAISVAETAFAIAKVAGLLEFLDQATTILFRCRNSLQESAVQNPDTVTWTNKLIADALALHGTLLHTAEPVGYADSSLLRAKAFQRELAKDKSALTLLRFSDSPGSYAMLMSSLACLAYENAMTALALEEVLAGHTDGELPHFAKEMAHKASIGGGASFEQLQKPQIEALEVLVSIAKLGIPLVNGPTGQYGRKQRSHALEAARRLIRLAPSEERSHNLVYVILGYAYALLALGDSSSLEEAERLLTEAQVVLDKLSDVRDLRAQTSIYQSIVFCRQGRFEPGLKVIDRVIASSTGIDDGYFRCCRAELLNQAGRHQEALTEAQKALTGPDVDYAGVAHEQLAIAQDALGNAADAMSEIRLALGTALAQYPVSPAVQRHLNAAARILERHNALESFRATEAAELLFEVQRAGLEGVDDEIAWDEDEEHRILAATLVQRRLEAQDNLGALASADRFRARSLAEISALPKGKLLTDTSIGHERLPLNSTLDEQITFVAETARRTLKKWGIPPPLEGADLSELIARHGRTVVLFHPTGPHLRIFTVRPETPRQIHTAVAKAAMGDIVALSEALRSQLGTMVAGRAARGDFPSQAAEELIEFPGSKISEPTNELNRLRQELYSALFSEVVHLFQRDDPIVLVPYRELSVIPFGVLTDSDGTPLIDKSPCSVLPSIASLGVLKTSETQRAHAVVLGDPLLSSAMGLDSLPWAADEAESVGAKLGSRDICTTVLTGPVATAENFRRHATGALFVHLACHAALREPASASRLFLAPSLHDDGSLLPAEIEDLRFGGALVVLSACQSGLGRATADGVLGLGRAFINAGARAVVLSLWRVGDEVTSLLMDEFYDNLLGTNGHQEHTDAAEALRRAQRKTSVSCYGDVGFWGPWILLGDGGWRLAV